MPNDDRFTPVVDYIKTLLENDVGLALADVFYGDQNLIPRTPAAAVEAGPFRRELAGAGGKGRTENSIIVYILVYVNRVSDEQATRKAADELAEAVMDVLHEDVTMNGHVIHGYVTEITPGYITKNRVLMRTARVTWEGLTKGLIN